MTKLFSIFKEAPFKFKEPKKQNKIKKERKQKLQKQNKKNKKNRKERNLECDCCFEIRTIPFYLKQNWKYRESVNVSCKAMDKPFDP